MSDFSTYLREIPPKGHNATHIIGVMTLLGPLIHLWSLPMERKHRERKKVANSTSSHANLPYTISIRNQLYMSYLRYKYEDVESHIQLGTIIDENANQEFQNIHPNIKSTYYCKKLSFVKISGKRYEFNTVIVLKIDRIPVFAKIYSIYKATAEVYFYVQILKNVDEFNQYYHAYEVEDLPF